MKRKLITSVICLLCALSSHSQISHVRLTVYHPVKEQCDDDPLTTADGSRIDLRKLKQGKVRWCAVSRDLLWLFPKNKPKRIWIDGHGVYEVRDVMNKRHGHSVDLLKHPSDKEIFCKNNVKIKILK